MLKTRTKMSKRKVPVLRIQLNQGATYEHICLVQGMEDLVMKTTVEAVAEGIEKKKKTVSLFEVADSEYFIELEKPQWVSSLEKAMKYYAGLEDYNTCIKCRELIKQIK